jgi:uncharacterized protein (TIGR02246 family)
MTNQGTSTEVQAAIEAANEVFMATFNRGDSAVLAELYTENGQLLPAGSDFVTGREAIQNFWQGVMDMGIKSANLETIEVEGHRDTAIDVGKYTLRGESENVLDRGKYLVVWKQLAGQWKLHRDIWTSSLSPQGD